MKKTLFKSEQMTVRSEQQAYSTPFMKIGKGDLALPYITNYNYSVGYVHFGADNLYPQILNQLYYYSPIHNACIDFICNAVLGGGVTLEGDGSVKTQVEHKAFMSRHNINKLARKVVGDFKRHDRVHVLLSFSGSGKFLKMKLIDPSYIRYRFDGNFDYSSDWSTRANYRTIEAYHPAKKCEEMLYTYGEPGAGQDFYPIPAYTTALNWIYLDGEQSLLHKSNIQNSIFPSLAIRRPKRFGSKKEVTDFIDGLQGNKGAENGGNVMVLTGDGFDNTPELVQVSANQNDNLFLQTSKEIKDNICFAHKINPSIMGVKVQGSLGNAQELEMSYSIFEKNVVKPMREEVEQILNELLRIAELDGKIKINGYKIIGEEIVEEDAIDNKTGELLNAMSPLLANKVLENLTINETRALAGLKPIEGGNKLPVATEPTQQTFEQ
jgi:hypothetical protein